MTRQFWVVAHRWAGLTIALFLIVAGSTGALLAFNEELTDATQPWRLVTPPSADAPLLDPVSLNEAALKSAPEGYSLGGLNLKVEAGRALEVGLNKPEGGDLPYLQAAIDPYTGKLLHIGEWGAISAGWHEIMPFIYTLHYKLAIDVWGLYAFGIAALIWTIDCFVGFYLTLPLSKRGWWRRWRKACGVRLPVRNRYKLNVDLHLASGLWLWPVLLVFAWSSVAMNLREVYDPVMRLLGVESPYAALPDKVAAEGFKPDWRRALIQAKTHAAAQGEVRGYQTISDDYLYFDSSKNVFSYSFRTSLDFTNHGGWSTLSFYPDGRLAQTLIADGGLDEGGVDNWMFALHMANVWGLPYRIFVSVLGLAITALSVTGVLIWTRKRSARLLRCTTRSAIGTLQPAE